MAITDFDDDRQDDPYRQRVMAGMGGPQSPDGGGLPLGGQVDSSPPGGGLPPTMSTSGRNLPPQQMMTSAAAPDDGLVTNPPNSGVPNNTGIAGPGDTTMPQSRPPGGFDAEKVRTGWAYGGSGFGTKTNLAELQKFLADNPAFASGVTLRGEKLYDPSGRYMFDAIGNFSGGDPNGMTRIALQGNSSYQKGKPGGKTPPKAKPKVGGPLVSHPGGEFGPGGPTPGGPGGVVGGAGTGTGTGTGGGGTVTTPPAANDFLTQIRQQIMDRLAKMGGDPSMQDPALAAQSSAYARARSRGADEQRAAMAERAAANGTLQGGQSSGSFDTELGGILEAKGEDIASNDARLLGAEVSARRNEVQSLLNMALQSGDAESARTLQSQLAQLDAQLRREALAENARQFGLSDKYRYAALGENRRQFDKDLGYRNRTFDDQFGRTLNRDYEDDYWKRVLYGMS